MGPANRLATPSRPAEPGRSSRAGNRGADIFSRVQTTLTGPSTCRAILNPCAAASSRRETAVM